ncbi:MAG: hypothetical protein PW735_03015 [Acidobacteriaceae bacterium]|nr:hypothetical protein [Acidobacteriaceae bacterium]
MNHREDEGCRRYGATLSAAMLCLLAAGCASPGPPHPPSLALPAASHKMSAERIADAVQISLSVPERTTDHLIIHDKRLGLRLCREDHPGAACQTITGAAIPEFLYPGSIITLTDPLPPALATGEPRLIAYRVELKNSRGRSAGLSAPAFTLAGAAPAPVQHFQVRGSRLGVVLSWQPQPGDDTARILITRNLADPQARHKAAAHHQHDQETFITEDQSRTATTGTMLDNSALEDVAYSYVARRERTLTVAGHTLTVLGADSPVQPYTLHDIYPPLAPTNLTAAGFDNGTVDLVWEPVEDPALAGYNLYREDNGARRKLNTQPLTEPAFHDTTVPAGAASRWSVTAVDASGNESPATTTLLPRP